MYTPPPAPIEAFCSKKQSFKFISATIPSQKIAPPLNALLLLKKQLVYFGEHGPLFLLSTITAPPELVELFLKNTQFIKTNSDI